jgi:hypothetical protein
MGFQQRIIMGHATVYCMRSLTSVRSVACRGRVSLHVDFARVLLQLYQLQGTVVAAAGCPHKAQHCMRLVTTPLTTATAHMPLSVVAMH